MQPVNAAYIAIIYYFIFFLCFQFSLKSRNVLGWVDSAIGVRNYIFIFWTVNPVVISWYLGDLSWVGLPDRSCLVLLPMAYILTSVVHLVEDWYRVRFRKDKSFIQSLKGQRLTIKGRLRELGIQLYSIGLPEEFVSRGFVVTFLIPLTGHLIAALISGATFGIFHLASRDHPDSLKAVTTGLTGFILALSFISSTSVWIPVTVHILLNQDLLKPALKLCLAKK